MALASTWGDVPAGGRTAPDPARSHRSDIALRHGAQTLRSGIALRYCTRALHSHIALTHGAQTLHTHIAHNYWTRTLHSNTAHIHGIHALRQVIASTTTWRCCFPMTVHMLIHSTAAAAAAVPYHFIPCYIHIKHTGALARTWSQPQSLDQRLSTSVKQVCQL